MNRALYPADHRIPLSQREMEMLLHFASGRDQPQACAMFAISTKTVTTYKARIAEKLGLYTPAEMAHYALHHGLIKNKFS